MFYKYEIRNVNGENILYLYMTMKYEFSKEFSGFEDQQLSILSNNFIKMNHIPYTGNKVYLVVDGFVVKRLDITNQNSFSDPNYKPDNFLINIKLEDNSLCEITLREYLRSILFSKYSNELGDEVLKALCVLYNTFSYKMMQEEHYIVANSPFCYYKPSNEYQETYKNYDPILKRLDAIIDSVECIYLSYDGKYILPFIHYSNSGRTLSNIHYPYLSSVKSLWDIASPYYISIVDVDYKDIYKYFRVRIKSDSNINILKNGTMIQLGDKTFTVYEVRSILKLKSNDISIIVNKGGIRFITKGIGNSLGLSIFGSSCIEANDGKYYHMLSYYFPKCRIHKYIKELS